METLYLIAESVNFSLNFLFISVGFSAILGFRKHLIGYLFQAVPQ